MGLSSTVTCCVTVFDFSDLHVLSRVHHQEAVSVLWYVWGAWGIYREHILETGWEVYRKLELFVVLEVETHSLGRFTWEQWAYRHDIICTCIISSFLFTNQGKGKSSFTSLHWLYYISFKFICISRCMLFYELSSYAPSSIDRSNSMHWDYEDSFLGNWGIFVVDTRNRVSIRFRASI